MTEHQSIAVLTIVCATTLVMVVACDDDEGTTDPHPFDPPPTTCDVPSPPAPLGRSVVVGSGSPESCNEEALREALAGGGDVTFDCGGGDVTIPVTSELVVAADTYLDGAGSITLDGGGSTRIVHTDAHTNLVVQGLRFVNGDATGDDPGSGGAIRIGWRSTLHVFDCSFEDNRAAAEGIEGGGAIYQSNGGEAVIVRSVFQGNSAISGGAIDNLLSPLTVVSSSFVENQSYGGGGAIYTDGASENTDDAVGGVISICGCQFESNESVGTGGAVYLWAYEPDELIINQCSFVGNRTTRPEGESALGGAMRTGNAPCQIANSLFAENHADVHGGAYWTRGNYATSVENCTFFRNTAGVPGQEGGYGGALSGFNTHVLSCTFVENHAEHTGGALFAEGEQWTLNDSVFLDNSSSNEWSLSQTCTDTIDGGHVIQWPAPGGDGDPACTQDAVFSDPLLGELSDQGGPTQTIPLLEGSPAIDAGEGCPDNDQRGESRDASCDLGAFEL